MGARKLLSKTIDVVEVAVRLVLVLLFNLGIVEALVIKLGYLRRRWFRSRSANVSSLKGLLLSGRAKMRCC